MSPFPSAQKVGLRGDESTRLPNQNSARRPRPERATDPAPFSSPRNEGARVGEEGYTDDTTPLSAPFTKARGVKAKKRGREKRVGDWLVWEESCRSDQLIHHKSPLYPARAPSDQDPRR